MVAWVGSPLVELMARMGAHCLVVPLQKFRQGSPPLLRGVQDGGSLLGLLAWVGTHQVHLMARVGARGVGAVRRPIR